MRIVAADGVVPYVLDLERAAVEDVAAVVVDSDAVVFVAGAGPGSGARAAAPRASTMCSSPTCRPSWRPSRGFVPARPWT